MNTPESLRALIVLTVRPHEEPTLEDAQIDALTALGAYNSVPAVLKAACLVKASAAATYVDVNAEGSGLKDSQNFDHWITLAEKYALDAAALSSSGSRRISTVRVRRSRP